MRKAFYSALVAIVLVVTSFVWGRLAAGELPTSGGGHNLLGFVFSEYGLLGLVAAGAVLIAYKSYNRNLERGEQAEKKCRELEAALVSMAQRHQDILKGLEEELRRLNFILSTLYALPEDVAAKVGGERDTRVLRKD